MIILHAAPIDRREIGGLRMSIPALVAAQNRVDGVQAAIVVTTGDPGPSPLGLPIPCFDRRLPKCGGGRLWLPAPFDRPDLVVFHSTYIPFHALLAARLRRLGIPYLLCPRGGMTRFAQSFRRWKKCLANRLFFNKLVAGAAAIHCLTQGEADASGGWRRPVFVVGNGIDIPSACDLAAPGRSPRRRLVFIGRLHLQYKGLDLLVDACRMLQADLLRADATVEVYGPDCGGSHAILATRIARLGLRDLVRLHGPVAGEAKSEVFRQADVFLHPSRSEGHPMAVLEALAHGVPCLVTPATNMAEEIVAAGAGWQVEPSVEAVAAGLRQTIGAESPWLARAGRNAHRLAAEHYAWDQIASQSIQEYRRYSGCRSNATDEGNTHAHHLSAPVLQNAKA